MVRSKREELAEILSRSRHPVRWEYRATSNIQDEDYVQADAVLDWIERLREEHIDRDKPGTR